MTSVYTAEKSHSFKICRKFFYSVTYTAFLKKPRTIHNNIILFANVCSVEKTKWKKGSWFVWQDRARENIIQRARSIYEEHQYEIIDQYRESQHFVVFKTAHNLYI